MKQKSYLCATIASALLTAGIAAAAVAPSTSIRYKFRVGETQTYDVVMQTAGSITMAGGPARPISQNADVTISQTVQSVDPKTGAATIVARWQSETSGLSVSGRPVPAQAAGAIPAMTVTSVMEPTGQLDSYHMATPAGSKSPLDMGTNSPMYAAVFAPSRPVTLGEVWDRETSGGPMGMNIMTHYRLASLTSSGGHQVATVDSDLSGTLETDLTTPVHAHVASQFTGNQSAQFDNTLGIVKSVSSSSHVVSAVDAVVPNTPQAGAAAGTTRHITSDITQTITMTLVNQQ